jgi:hypothetical protein
MTPHEAHTRLAGFERVLLSAPSADVRFHCVADAPLDAELDGSLELKAPGSLSLQADGRLRGEAFLLRLSADGSTFSARTNEHAWSGSPPTGLFASVAIGWVRLGFTDVIVRLANGDLPREAEGDILRNVLLTPINVETDDVVPHLATAYGLASTVRVRGRDTQVATIWLDEATDLPIQRTFTVGPATHGWSIGIGETYSDVRIGG